MILLDSVGTFIDIKTNITYPANIDSTPDMDNPLHLDEIESNEWFESLSAEDSEVVYGGWKIVNN
jgi:hypothetical protein|tara:strand:- start:139 stop:333 length:195 start_codon:yes stop_codon:yes gene_type:complete